MSISPESMERTVMSASVSRAEMYRLVAVFVADGVVVALAVDVIVGNRG